MAEMAKVIRVRPGKGMKIDGKEFPWYFADGVDIHLARSELVGVTIKIIAERVEIDDSTAPKASA